ncbi:MAG TPA: hypothetical protein VD793_11365, partial [Gemmatimonadales bacterium]|nr:hypothetical protein [Gemmatimonadales bacterium]
MNCAQARPAMLEADLPELQGGSTPLALHLRDCETCRRQARAIIAAEHALGRALAEQRPAVPADEAIRSAARSAGSRAGPGSPARRWAAPLALAAGIAGVIWWGTMRPPDRPGAEPLAATVSAALPPLAVQGPAGGTVSVFQTANPDVVVIW